MIHFIDNKYTKWYFQIIDKAIARAKTRKDAKLMLGEVEGHHIYPKSIIKNNQLVYLSIKEHFVCHWLLTKMTSGSDKYKMEHAMTFFTKRQSLTPFEIKIMLPFKHKPCSDERRFNISQARKHTQKKLCPHCNRETDPGNYIRFHGDNCKFNPAVDQEHIKNRSDAAKLNIMKLIENNTYSKPKPLVGEFTCPHCGKIGTNYGAMKQHHFNNCPHFTGEMSKCRVKPLLCCCMICKKEIDNANIVRHYSKCSNNSLQSSSDNDSIISNM